MNRILSLLLVALTASVLPVAGQNVSPVVSSQIADFTGYAGAPTKSIDLLTAFSDPDASNAVRFTTVLGTFDVALFGQQKPITVTNFLKYVDQGRYFLLDPTTNQIASSFVHRSKPGFVIQGGGFIGTVDPADPMKQNAQPTQVAEFGPIQNEPGISNKRATIAMAKFPNDPNSATSEWFINLANNGGAPTNLDTQNGGFTVFGRVAGNGMTVVDAIAAVPVYDASNGNPSSPFTDLPLRNYTSGFVKVSHFVSIPGLNQISPLNFSAVSDTSNVTVSISGTKLLVTPNSVGTAHVTVTATDLDGATISQMFTVNVIAAPGRLVNLSTRMQVGTGDNALIAGFIMQGTASKRLAIRALGPSLSDSGISNALDNPVLELRNSSNAVLATNDNWGDAPNKQDLTDIGLAPNSPNESAILTTVPSNTSGAAYTAVMRGVNNATGVGVVEVYDLDSGPSSTLLNISTRGPVGLDPNALIAGFTLGGAESKTVLVRAIGPSLTGFGVPNALVDPTMEFFNGQGMKIDSNDDWMNSPQKSQIESSGLAPTNAKESAIVQTLPSGPYTAVVRGTNGGTGVGSVEVYQLP
ncbi:MAG TPA: peptidylprolyl isomerase [Chthoniobacterales bacterium]|jgi:cyclophilin family peptidyl-prolyl cis-trans isomerase|nr:peptidylprolyl isomerase [Chthoniobacterales bacterium]